MSATRNILILIPLMLLAASCDRSKPAGDEHAGDEHAGHAHEGEAAHAEGGEEHEEHEEGVVELPEYHERTATNFGHPRAGANDGDGVAFEQQR